MPRGARLDAPGTLHHIIAKGIEKRRIVNDVADRKNFVTRLEKLSAETKTNIYAWALLTNHAHMLLRSSEIGLSGSKIIKRQLISWFSQQRLFIGSDFCLWLNYYYYFSLHFFAKNQKKIGTET